MGPCITAAEGCEPQDGRVPNWRRHLENDRNPISKGELRAHAYYTSAARDYTSTIANALRRFQPPGAGFPTCQAFAESLLREPPDLFLWGHRPRPSGTALPNP